LADPIGTVFVEVRPDLTRFEAELSAKLTAVVRGIVPPTAGLTKAAGAQSALGASTRRTTKALSEQAAVMQANSTELARFSRGVAATSLAQFGLRGATLAATSSFLAGAAAITALSKAVGVATSFNSQLAVFAATTGATADQMARVSDASKSLGRDLTLPGVSATDAAQAMTELGKAGLSVEDAIAGARGVLQLGVAANIDFAQATELAASALNAFQLSGDKAVVVADTLANAANAAQGSIVDVGIAFQQAAAIGHQVGLTFQDTTLFITELARAGLTGSDAGTSLRTALVRLINPTKKAKEIFKELGIEVRDAQGNLRPEFFTNLGIALSKMSKAQRDANLATIGGQDAVRALSILSRGTSKDVIALRDELAKQGTAAKVAGARMTGLAGAGSNLSNTVESLALNLGQKATPSLIAATNALTGFITGAAQSPVVDLLGQTIHVTAQAFHVLADAVRILAPLFSTFVGGLSAATSAIGPSTILVGVAAYLALSRVISTTIPKLTAFVEGLIAVRAASVAAAEAGVATQGLAAGLAASLTGVGALTVGLAALTAGFFFLATRESDTEKATKRLKAATDDLTGSLADAASAQETLKRAQSALGTDKIALDSQKLAVVQARRALEDSKAAAGSFERAQLENRLAFALDSVRLAQQQVAADQAAITAAEKTNTQATKNRTAALAEEAHQLRSLQKAIAVAQPFKFLGDITGDLETKAQQKLIDKINERAAAERKANTDSGRAVADRLDALAKLAAKVNDLPTTITLLFNAKDVDTGLKQVEANLRNTGQTGAAAFTEQLRIGLDPRGILSPLGNLPGLFKQLGAQSGENFSAAIIAAVQNAMAILNGLILRGANQQTIRLANQTATLLSNVQRIELAGGSLDQQLSAAKEARARADRELAAADAAVRASHGRSKAAKERQASALQDVASAQGDIDRIQSEIASKAKDAAAARKKIADDAKKARDKADQAFIDALGVGQANRESAITKASLTKSLVDDIAAQRALSAFIRQEIVAAGKTIHDIHTRIQTIRQLTTALIQSQVTTKQLLDQQKENTKQRIIDKRDRQQESLELDVQIAETEKNKAKELKAHQRLLAFLEARQKHTDQGTLAWKKLQLQIEQEKAAIRDLKKADKARADELKSLEFQFLQTQTGFVANLLGNLLPIGAVAGTVGGSTAAAVSSSSPTVPAAGFATAVHQRPTVVPPADFATAAHRRGVINAGVTTAAGQGATAGASFGQMSALITIARAQLAVLQSVTGKRSHPEANVQRAAQHAAMDTLPF
jgi:TP901 family phage tail tape measure protein